MLKQHTSESSLNWHGLTWIGGTFESDTGGTFHSDMPGTFQSAADGTFVSAIDGTFQSDMSGTFGPLLSNTLWICILWFLHTLNGVLSTKLMPVHLPSNTFFIIRPRGRQPAFQVPRSGCRRQPWGRGGEGACRLFLHKNALGNDNQSHETIS